jgi:cyclophilin family peptidyl-prolyl cis-trans isomerase/HEAT repeat protein
VSKYWTKKDFFGVVRASAIIPAALLMLLSCADLEQRYIKQDKLFKIALIEDSRINDTLLTSDYFLSDPDPDIRARAAQAVGRIGGNFYSRALKNYLRDSISSVAEAKYFAAGLTGDSSLFDSLFNLAQSDPIGREVAVEALGRIATVEQATKLATFLTDRDSMVVYQAILAMWRADEWSQASMIADMGRLSGNRLIKYGTLYSLARSGRAEGRDLFLGLLSDPDPEFRMLAYSGLGRSADTASIKQIAGGLNDTDRRVAASAMNALRRFGDWGSIYVCEKLPGLTDEKLVVLGLEIIGDFPNVKNAKEVAQNILTNDGRENVLAASAAALLKIDGVRALAVIDEKLTSPSAWQRLSIAGALTSVDPNAAIARLTLLFNDPAPLVRATALESLCSVDSVSAAVYIKTALSDTDFVVTSTAVDLASGRGLTGLIPAIAGLYLENRNFIDDDLKRAIIDAWSNYESNPGYDSLIIASLEEGCNDEWFLIRKEASEVLWDKYKIDRRIQVQGARSLIEKRNFRDRFYRYETNPLALLKTSRGIITIELLYDKAPQTVNNFISLAEDGFYDNRVFHRVVPNFVIQDGCPRGDGWGGPGYAIRCENNRLSYTTGMVGMALSGKDTGGSQYFITLSPQPHLDARYTIFGRVISGMDVAQQIVRGDPIMTVTIQYKREET